jgi:hypothetical protein
MKAYSGSRTIAQFILTLGTRWRRMVNFKSRPLYPRERTPVPIEQVGAWPLGTFWALGKEKDFLPLPGFEPLSCNLWPINCNEYAIVDSPRRIGMVRRSKLHRDRTIK